MASSATGFLADTQNSDGGWGYGPGQGSNVEATAAVALALAGDSSAAQLHESAVAWLQAAQNPDGGWGFARDDRQSGWMTAWAVLALAEQGAGGDAPPIAAGEAWLVGTEAAAYDAATSAAEIEQAKKNLEIDVTLRAWPWLPKQATFVEPTALALWALASAQPGVQPLIGGKPSAAAQARVDEAVRYLVDRRCRPGGWNVGNPMMFSQALPPRACPTAWTLLALAKAAPEAIRPEDIDALREDMRIDGGALALAWGLCALHALGQQDAEARARLAALQQPDGGWNGNPYTTAVAVIAAKERS